MVPLPEISGEAPDVPGAASSVLLVDGDGDGEGVIQPEAEQQAVCSTTQVVRGTLSQLGLRAVADGGDVQIAVKSELQLRRHTLASLAAAVLGGLITIVRRQG